MTISSQEPELSEAAAAVRAQPSDFGAWDALEAEAEARESPEAVAELYVEALSGDLAAPLARKLSERSLRFGEAWFGDDAPQMQALLAKVFALDPRDDVIFERLVVSLTAAGRWDLLGEVYERALRATDSRERRAQLLDDALKVAKDLAADEGRTLSLTRELFGLRPDDTALRTQFERLLEKAGRYQELVLALSARAGESPSAELSLRLAGLWLRQLRSAPTALEIARGLLGVAEVEADALALVEEIFGAEESPLPSRRSALELLSAAYEARRDPLERARVLRLGAQLYDGAQRVALHRDAARLLRTNGRAAEALDEYGEAFSRAPSDDALRLELEEHALAAALEAPYAALLEKVAAIAASTRDAGPDHVGAQRHCQLLLRAAELHQQALRQPAQAVALYRRVLAQEEVPEAALEAGRALDALYDEAGEAPSRMGVLARLSELEPVEPVRRELIGAQAKLALSLGDDAKAVEAYRRRLEVDAGDSEALDGLIALHERRGEVRPLIEMLRRRASLLGDLAGARDMARIGQLYADELRDLDQGLKALGAAQAQVPELSEEIALEALLNRAASREIAEGARRSTALAEAYGQWLADPEQALAHYARALAIAPDQAEARVGVTALLGDERVQARAADLLAGAYATTDDVDGLLSLLPHRLAGASSGPERARLLRQAAQLEATRRNAPERAFAYGTRALVEDPQDITGDLELWRLAEQLGTWAELAATLRTAADRLDAAGPRRGQLRVSEGELCELRLLDLPRALDAYQAAARALPADAAVAEAVCRVAALIGRYGDALDVVVTVADRLDQIPERLLVLLEERATESDGHAALSKAGFESAVQGRLKPPVRRALLLRVAEWFERGAGDLDAAERTLLEASKLGGPHAETLRRLAGLQRRKPGRELFDTLLDAAELDDRELSLLSEAAELARGRLHDGALERTVLERLVRRSANLSREGKRASDGSAPEEVLVDATRRLADILSQAGESRAELTLLREAAGFPVAKHSARMFAERAARLAVEALGDAELSIALYQRALELEPEDPALLAAVSDLYARAGKLDDLVVLRRRELAATPSLSRRLELRLELARVLGELEARGGRLSALRENLEEVPGHRESLADAERILRAQGNTVATFSLLSEQAARLEAIGETAQAASLWARAAELADVEMRDEERALVAYQRLAGIEHDERALVALARIRLARHEPHLAVPWLERTLEIRAPEQRAETRLRLASAYESAGNTDAALRTLEAAVAEAPDEEPLRERLATLYEREQRYLALADLLADSAARAADPERLLSYARRAAALYRAPLGIPERGVDVLSRAVAAQPGDRGLKLDYVDALIAAGRASEAREVLDAMVLEFGRRRSPERAELHMRLSRVAEAEGNVEEALTQLDTAASMDRSHAGILRSLGELAQKAGQLDRAERAYRTLLIVLRKQPQGELDPGASPILYELHRIALELGQREKAAELLEQAVQTAVNSESETARLKSLLLERGEPELLLRVLELRLSQVSSAATEAEVLSDLADVLENTLERKDEALDARLKALSCAPELDDLHTATLRVARALRSERRYVETLGQLIERARRRDEHALLGDLALRAGSVCEHALGELPQAADYYREVTAEMPGYIEAQFALARVAGKLGRDDEERAVLERLTSLPDEPVFVEGKRSAVYRLIELQVQRPDTRDAGLAALSRLLADQPDYARASQILKSAYESDPTDLGTLTLLEQTARQSGDPQVLLEALERRVQRDDVALELVREAAELAASVGEGVRTEALTKRALALAEARDALYEVGWAPLLLARSFSRRGDLDAAFSWFERALHVSDPDESFELGLELAAHAAGGRGADRERAMRVYERLREDHPADRRVWAPLLAFYTDQGDYDRMLDIVRATLEVLDTGAARIALRLETARLLLEAGREEEGAALLEQVVEEDPDHGEAALRLADLYERRGQLDDLVDLLHRKLERAREQRSPSVIPLSLRMGAMLAQTRPDQAAELYRSALELMPESDALLRAAIEQCGTQEQAEERADLIVRYLSAADASERENARAYASWLVEYRGEQLEPENFELALELAHRATPDNPDWRRRLLSWHKERGNQRRVAELIEGEAQLSDSRERAIALLIEAGELRETVLGQAGQAAALFRKARELAPTDFGLLKRAVSASAAAGELTLAVGEIDAALGQLDRGAPERIELLRLKAELSSQAGLHDQAVASLLEAHELGGEAVAEALLSGLEGAREAARERRDEKRERELTLRLAQLFRDYGDGDRAIAVLHAWNEFAGTDVEALRMELAMASQVERWDDVVEIAETLCAEDDVAMLPEITERLVEATRALGRSDLAKVALERAYERAPGESRILAQLEVLYRELGDKAAQARLLAVQLDREHDPERQFDQLRRVGQLLVEAGDADGAMEYLTRALEKKPDDLTTVVAVVDAHIAAGRTDHARELLERTIGALRQRRSPELAQLRHRMAKLFASVGDEQGRYDWLNSALEADMNNGEVASELAIVAQQIGHLDTALKALRAITMMKGEATMSRAEAFYRQAVIVAQKGEPRRAVLWAKKAKAEDQDFPGVDRLIAELESA